MFDEEVTLRLVGFVLLFTYLKWSLAKSSLQSNASRSGRPTGAGSASSPLTPSLAAKTIPPRSNFYIIMSSASLSSLRKSLLSRTWCCSAMFAYKSNKSLITFPTYTIYTEMKTAYHTIEQLQQRVIELKQHRCERGDHHISAERPAPPSTCLLLGDTNLSPILPSDLHHTW